MTRKISDGVARIKLGLADELRLGNLDSERDWALPPITSRRCGRCCSATSRKTTSAAMGETHSVREFAEIAFGHAGLDWEQYVKTDPGVHARGGSTSSWATVEAKGELGWEPKHTFRELVEMMVDADLGRVSAVTEVARSPLS